MADRFRQGRRGNKQAAVSVAPSTVQVYIALRGLHQSCLPYEFGGMLLRSRADAQDIIRAMRSDGRFEADEERGEKIAKEFIEYFEQAGAIATVSVKAVD